jgi:alcohol dehydrogenase (NADP+)
MYARNFGCDVVVFSGSEAKRADAIALGATEFCVLPSQPQPILDLKGNINVVLICGGGLPNFELYVFATGVWKTILIETG